MFRTYSSSLVGVRDWLFCLALLAGTTPVLADFDIPDATTATDKAATSATRKAAARANREVSKSIAVFKDSADDTAVSDNTATAAPSHATDTSEAHADAPMAPMLPPTADYAGAMPGQCHCQAVYCDCAATHRVGKRIRAAHQPLFYNNDLGYLCDPCYSDVRCNDPLKRFCLKGTSIETGGQTRFRYHNENNFRGSGVTGVDDDFLLSRNRLYLDWDVSQNIRFFAEFLDANSSFENFAPRAIEENHADLLNLFVDLKLWENSHGSLSARLGRQEMSFGAERYISPLDWANTRRTFEGYRFTWEGSDWDVDGFFVNPVVVDRRNFDDGNNNVDFYGVYASNKKLKNASMDLYWLALDNDVTGEDSDTVGVRYNRNLANNNLFDFEGGYQFGDNADGSDKDALFFTVGLGHKFNHRLKPTAWVYYDYAEGGNVQGAGNGFDQLFPLGHKYLGYMDLFGRSNIEDLNFLLTMELSPKAKLILWYHNFWLQDGADTPYDVNGQAFAPGVTPGDDELGQEFDVLLSLDLTARTNLLLGYSHFFAGDYYDTAGLPVNGTDADFFYTQLQFNF